jgi:hypothetical protein
LCCEGFKNFYVLTKSENNQPERHWAGPGRDAIYSGLVLFFWFVGEKMGFLLEGADLTDSPFFMDRVFSNYPFNK